MAANKSTGFYTVGFVSPYIKKWRNYKPICYRYTICAILVLCLVGKSLEVSAQQKDSSSSQQSPSADTAKTDIVSKVKAKAARVAKLNALEFKSDKDAIRQEELMQNIKATTEKAKAYLKTGFDTIAINAELAQTQKWIDISGDGVFTNKGTNQTYRNLTTTSKILLELLKRTNNRKSQLDKYEKDVLNFRSHIDSLASDSILYDFPDDSAAVVQYLQKFVVLNYTIIPADSALKSATTKVHVMQTKINTAVYKLSAGVEEIDGYQKELYAKTFDREFANIWGTVAYDRPFGEILYLSLVKGKLIFLFYAQNNVWKILLLIVLIIGATFFIKSLKQMLVQEKLLRTDFAGQLILRYPVLSAIIIVLNLFQFIFDDPPFVFNALFWTISAIALTIIFKNFISKYWMRVWLAMVILFLVASADNLVLQASRAERWGMLFWAIAGICTGSLVLFKGHKNELREKLILYFIALLVLMELASVFTNVFGRYNLSKALLISGSFNVIIGILFLWTIRLINEGLALASSVYTKQERKLFYINFERVGEKAPFLFYVLLIIGWFILMGRNFYAYRLISEPLKNFFFAERTIGQYAFTVSNLLVFFLIMAFSVVTSKIVSFFASDKHPVGSPLTKERKAGLGSWLLLIRVSIISIGLFLGLAASGFPMDRITIVIGALGLGVGLGLQTLVNNLVSGLIIAFEKPVNVGDVVEISGQAGTMKSIGFRSSVISIWAGADVVIPNGDLLNAHLVNWTLGGNKRRMDIIVGVSFGTDLEKTKKILLDLLEADERILKYPGPGILFQEFNNSSIDVKVLFWVRDFREGLPVKSDVITAIDTAFKQNGIIIPFPQRDLHIRTTALPSVKDNGDNIETETKQ